MSLASVLVLWHWPHFLEPISQLWWPETNRMYAFFSSIGGTPLFALGIFGFTWRHLNCHAPGCWRISRHHFTDPETGERHSLCKKHHPDAQPKAHWWSRRRVHSLEYIHAQIAKARAPGG